MPKSKSKGVKRKSEQELTQLSQKYAKFARASYARLQSSRINMVNDKDFTYDVDASTATQAVYHNHKTKEVITSFRGTKELDDLATDLAVAFGAEKLTPRFRSQAREYKKVLDKYGEGWTHSLAGHSLGGTINNYIMNKYRDRVDNVFNFNPGSSAAHAMAGLRARIHNQFEEKLHEFYIEGDPLSIATGAQAKYDTRHVLVQKKKDESTNPHTIDQFL
jgi:pimeloyl-ACP methyl ester carboxylesterase